ncbi:MULTISPECIES: hypothetical protein [Methylobacillus]|uniref:hypothetical protein n=1 Tax=Methylobacillus TaxID=404 RepID=UPI000039DFBD|nr:MULTISPECIES: hypothetical protein [Methylobacillus]MPS47475.1 hypothetical protein [Methylobacillus sp.]
MRQALTTALPQQLAFKVGEAFSLIRLPQAKVNDVHVPRSQEAAPADYCAVEGGVVADFQAAFPV